MGDFNFFFFFNVLRKILFKYDILHNFGRDNTIYIEGKKYIFIMTILISISLAVPV